MYLPFWNSEIIFFSSKKGFEKLLKISPLSNRVCISNHSSCFIINIIGWSKVIEFKFSTSSIYLYIYLYIYINSGHSVSSSVHRAAGSWDWALTIELRYFVFNKIVVLFFGSRKAKEWITWSYVYIIHLSNSCIDIKLNVSIYHFILLSAYSFSHHSLKKVLKIGSIVDRWGLYIPNKKNGWT